MLDSSPVEGRLALLGLEPGPIALLLLDALIVFVTSVGILRLADHERGASADTVLVTGLLSIGIVVLSATLLGGFGFLSWQSQLLCHAGLLLVVPLFHDRCGYVQASSRLLGASGNYLYAAVHPAIALCRRSEWSTAPTVSLLVATIVAILTCFVTLALFTLPLNYDSNLYRLTRIAYWLQERNIHHFATGDARVNYTPQNADLVMLWLTSFFDRGFPLVALAQFAGGLLSCGAVYLLSRDLRFPRAWCLAAVVAFIGIPNAATQWFTSQTDLFTTGCLVAGLVFLRRGLRSSGALDWALCGIGVGLALGAKGTVFYWAPGLLILAVGWALAAQTAPSVIILKRVTLAATIAVVLGGFNYAQNARTFGTPFVGYGDPFSSYRIVWASASAGHRAQLLESRIRATTVKGLAYAWQAFEPHSNIPGLRIFTGFLFERLGARLETLERPPFRAFPQAIEEARGWMAVGLSEDYASTGVLVWFLAVGAGIVSLVALWRSRSQGALELALVAISLPLYVGLFVLVRPWTIHHYRYFVVLTPFLAVTSVGCLLSLPLSVKRTALAGFVAVQVVIAGCVVATSRHHGLSAMGDPKVAPNYSRWSECRTLMRTLGDGPQRIALVFPPERWSAPCFRATNGHRITLVRPSALQAAGTLEGFLRTETFDVLVTEAQAVAGRFGQVRAQMTPDSGLVAVWLPRAGEGPATIVLGVDGVYSDGWTAVTALLSVENAHDRSVLLEMTNPTEMRRQVSLIRGSTTVETWLEPNERRTVGVPADSAEMIRLVVSPAFVPADVNSQSPDKRQLGVYMPLPDAVQ